MKTRTVAAARGSQLPSDRELAAWAASLVAIGGRKGSLAECAAYCRQQVQELPPAESRRVMAMVMEAAEQLAVQEIDADCLNAAMLYLLIVESGIESAKVTAHFPQSIVSLTEAAIRLSELDISLVPGRLRSTHQVRAENLRSMVLVMAGDLRVTLIALAERIVHLRQALRENRRDARALAREMTRIYAPIASRLGLEKLQREMEDLCFRAFSPRQYTRLRDAIQERSEEWGKNGSAIVSRLQKKLADAGLHSRVGSRLKSVYNIWRKMRRKNVGINSLHDMLGIRVIVAEEVDCYIALGQIHKHWRHLCDEFDDYIGNPKPNGYQSLHTAIIVPDTGTLEVQIRTEAMNREAENGACAHWRYKDTEITNRWFDSRVDRLRQWAAQGKGYKPESARQLFEELMRHHIYVFTKDGEAVELPAGATVLDFAYYLHTDMGHRCQSATVNERQVSLNCVLRNGQKVEIRTDESGEPKHEWLDPERGFLNTARGRERVQQWFRRLNTGLARQKGENMLFPELTRMGLQVTSARELATALKIGNVDQLLVEIGQHKRPLQDVLQQAAQIASANSVRQPGVQN